ncbi:MAG: hypothetical protein Ct9H90mP22_4810 [Gammaproteobacteria bacterium]|nr:MAG: hypothetical protein Ct9H90mP22_4810 [Gammaproteobacteria bacterium]
MMNLLKRQLTIQKKFQKKFEDFDLFGKYRMPKFPLYDENDSFSLLTKLSKKGLLKRLKKTEFKRS